MYTTPLSRPPRPVVLTVSLAVALAAPAFAGDFSINKLTGDSDSGINSALTYTVAADFVGPGTRVVNGVTFGETGISGTNYSLTGSTADFTGFVTNVAGNAGSMLTDFRFGSNGNDGFQTLTLTGLTPGVNYVTSWYNASFGAGNGRYIDITPSDTNVTFRYNEDGTIYRDGTVLRYAFTAPASGSITYSFDALSNTDTFHSYAMTNAVRNDSVFSYTHFNPVTPTITRVSGSTNPFTVSNNDLLQTSVAAVASTGNFNREPILGPLSVLNNGTFSITGTSNNNPELVTGEDNATVTFTLDTSVNTLGYDISRIAGYGGWNDQGRDRQFYSIFFSKVGSPDFTFFGQVDDNPVSPTGISAVSAVFDTSLTGIDAIRIEFLSGQDNGYAGYGEFDVIGTATVPEPTSAALVLIGCAGVSMRRRRR